MASRRVFLGSVAAAGVGTFGVASVAFPVAAQPTADLLTREIRRQLRSGVQKILGGNASDGARQLATTLRLYAATVNDDQVRALVKKASRQTALYGSINHGEMERLADDLGFPKSLLPHDTSTAVGREEALDRLLKEGLSPFMRKVADALDETATSLQGRAVQVRNVSLLCGDCGWACGLVQPALDAMTVLCSVALLFPPAMEVCMAATANYLTVWLACLMCQATVNC